MAKDGTSARRDGQHEGHKGHEGHTGHDELTYSGRDLGHETRAVRHPADAEELRLALSPFSTAREGRERAGSAARRGSEILREQREHLSEAVDRGVEAFDQVRKEIL